MASESVTETGRYYLPLDTLDRIDALLHQAKGVAQCVRGAAGSDLPDDAIPHACWAMERMLDEVGRLASQRQPQTAQEVHA